MIVIGPPPRRPDVQPSLWADGVAETLNEHGVKFKFVDGQVIPLESEELHAAVVEPVLRLFYGRPDRAAAQGAYPKALEEISKSDAGDAITDAATALQETLEALGCEGNSLGTLVASTQSRAAISAMLLSRAGCRSGHIAACARCRSAHPARRVAASGPP
jgi:hypothetical protein